MNSTSAGSGGPPRGPQFDNRRIAAGLIDLVTVLAIAIVVGFVAGFVAGPDKDVGGVMPVLVLAWALFYYFALESGNGQTLGKRIMGLRVLTVDGRHADMGEIGVRTVLRIIDGIGLYLVGLITMIATGQRRQRLGDLAAKTIVTSADWKPATGTQTTASAAATPASSAIVLPTAAPAAGPELPTAAVPSPFTPLATEPPPVVVDPPSATHDDHVVAEEPSFVTPDAPTVTTDPPVVAEEPSFATPVAPSDTIEPPVVAAESPSVASEEPVAAAEPTVTPGSPSATPEPSAVTVDSVETAAAPPTWNSEPAQDATVDSASIKDPIVDGPADGTWEPVGMPAPEVPVAADEPDEFDENDHVKVRSVETLSAMDLLMSELEEDEPAGHRPAS